MDTPFRRAALVESVGWPQACGLRLLASTHSAPPQLRGDAIVLAANEGLVLET